MYTIRSSDGGGLLRITTNPGGEDDPVDYSPDGTQIAFIRTDLHLPRVMSSLTRRSRQTPAAVTRALIVGLVRGTLACLGADSRNRRVVHDRHWGQHQVSAGN